MLAVGALSVAGGALVAVGGFAQTGTPPEAPAPVREKILAKGPDVRVFSLSTPSSNGGASGGFIGYAIGTVSCNRGDAPLNWCDQASGCAPGAGTEDHPVIAGNLYRLKSGRFEQIGMSWLKHGFLSTNSTSSGCTGAAGQSCVSPPAGNNQLGIGCTDPYGASLNGSRPLGRRSEVNGTTAIFPFPINSPGGPYQSYDQRLKVASTDVDAAQNPGATFWAEAQYFASDDAAAGNSLNNASYQRVTIGAATSYTMSLVGGSFVEAQSALNAWKAQDPTVIIANVDLPGTIVERFEVARKVTDLGGGLWHYEYAIRNHNSDRSARGFTVTFPSATTFSNIGFHDVEHHSGEPYSTADWAQNTTANAVSWSTDTFATDANANALRFATMFNFWFDANQAPNGNVDTPEQHTLDIFRPGDPTSVVFQGFNGLFNDGFEGGNSNAWNGGHT